MRLILNYDANFAITDERGDMVTNTEMGYYHEDTRYLSEYRLLLNGQPPVVLTTQALSSNQAVHYLINPTAPNLPRGTLVIKREQSVKQALEETLTITNYGLRPTTVSLDLLYLTDFGHIFEIKHEIELAHVAMQDDGTVARTTEDDGRTVRFATELRGVARQTVVSASIPAQLSPHGSHFTAELAPHASWQVQVRCQALNSLEATLPGMANADNHQGDYARFEHQRAALLATPTRVSTDSLVVQRAYEQGVKDIAALLMEDPNAHHGEVILAAGIPWFMTLFGRDSLITALQVLPFYPEVAKGVLRALARLQGHQVDLLHVEEPGKILHEYRSSAFTGTANSAAIFPYYGTIDATPLFLMLLGAVWRLTGDRAFIASLRAPMEAALAWMDAYGDRDGDGYIEYVREAAAGLENQGWKDSGDAIRYRDGRMPRAPIALCEVQGYAYAARLAVADCYDALGMAEAAQGQRARAALLRARFNHDFWMPDRQCFALALDAEKNQVDALTSNAGQLLWCGIVDDAKAAPLAQTLLAEPLFSGWGIRTMATTEGGYNPISYHCGTIWPHDNSLILAGLARYGLVTAAQQVAGGMIATLGYFPDGRFPELFAGFSRTDSPFPVEYPTASQPQAWAAGATLLLLATMGGFNALTPTLTSMPFLPPGLGRLAITALPLTADLLVQS